MVTPKIYQFNQLSSADLFIDALYKGGNKGNAGDDPISKLAGCGNQAGIRYVGTADKPKLCVLYSDLSQPSWPDEINEEFGLFTYFGDNRRPGRELHDTSRKGNLILRNIFNLLHMDNRDQVPPILIFARGVMGRDVVFKGIGVPGADGLNQTEDLVAVWKISEGQRFQNYKAIFTILNADRVTRAWINDIHLGTPVSDNTPLAWCNWIAGGPYVALKAAKSKNYRTKGEQLPGPGLENDILSKVIDYFKTHPQGEFAFERCAAEIAKLMDGNITSYELTRPWRDGGRDATGLYNIGITSNAIKVDFALEAKCHQMNIGSGVRETSRLISRLRHRQFGIFVTTSYLDIQAYKEIIEDQHPVIIISGIDIARILINAGYNSVEQVNRWLRVNF
jgi:hypothetical protein